MPRLHLMPRLYKLFVRYLVVKPACVNAALGNLFEDSQHHYTTGYVSLKTI